MVPLLFGLEFASSSFCDSFLGKRLAAGLSLRDDVWADDGRGSLFEKLPSSQHFPFDTSTDRAVALNESSRDRDETFEEVVVLSERLAFIPYVVKQEGCFK